MSTLDATLKVELKHGNWSPAEDAIVRSLLGYLSNPFHPNPCSLPEQLSSIPPSTWLSTPGELEGRRAERSFSATRRLGGDRELSGRLGGTGTKGKTRRSCGTTELALKELAGEGVRERVVVV